MIKKYEFIDPNELVIHLKTLVDKHTAISVSYNKQANSGHPDSFDAIKQQLFHSAKAEAYEKVIEMVTR